METDYSVLFQGLIISKFVQYKTPTLGKYVYPPWAVNMGWMMVAFILLWVPLFAIWTFCKNGACEVRMVQFLITLTVLIEHFAALQSSHNIYIQMNRLYFYVGHVTVYVISPVCIITGHLHLISIFYWGISDIFI